MDTRFDPRAKLGVLLIFLIAVSTTPVRAQTAFAGYAVLLFIAMLASGAGLKNILRRCAVALPFTAVFALLTWLAGDAQRAFGLFEKSILSVAAAVVVTLITPIHEIARALTWARLPRTLVLVIQFLHRYLFVVADEVRALQRAARSRSGHRGAIPAQFRAAAGALGVLFAKSWQRADSIYLAMLARGFRGTFPEFSKPTFRAQDVLLFGAGTGLVVALRVMTRSPS